MSKTVEQVESKVESVLAKPYVLILENDDVNSFDWVIKCLMKICNHEYEQANQSALLVHFKGMCDVKYGDYDTISLMKEKLQNCGLSVTMEVNM